jgi:Zn-dependent peptidase ImmA (M78 family)
MDEEVAAKRVGVKRAKLDAWETGNAAPTITQLRKLAHAYRRAVSFFFLSERPAAARRPTDFRKTELSATEHSTPELANAIREAQAKRDSAIDIYRELEETPPEFGIDIGPNAPPEDAADILRLQLGVQFAQRLAWADEYAALRAWKTAAEARGVLVMQVSGVALEEMRGCSLALFPLPIVLLNSGDRPLGRVFTLLHELTHLAARQSALCDVVEDRHRTVDAQRIEVHCNHVAGAVLAPSEHLLNDPDVARAGRRTEWSDEKLGDLRRRFWASQEVVLRRLLLLGKTSQAFYQRKREEFLEQYAQLAEDRESGFVPFPRRVVLGNGRLLTGLVIDAYDSRVITGSTLSRILGTKLDHLPKIVAELQGRAVA